MSLAHHKMWALHDFTNRTSNPLAHSSDESDAERAVHALNRRKSNCDTLTLNLRSPGSVKCDTPGPSLQNPSRETTPKVGGPVALPMLGAVLGLGRGDRLLDGISDFTFKRFAGFTNVVG